MQLAYYVVCIILVGLGLRAYLTADIMELPSDGVSLCIAWATKKPLHIIKRFFDCFCVILSSAVSILVLHDWEGIWIGTILAALFTGTSLKIDGAVSVLNADTAPFIIIIHAIVTQIHKETKGQSQ